MEVIEDLEGWRSRLTASQLSVQRLCDSIGESPLADAAFDRHLRLVLCLNWLGDLVGEPVVEWTDRGCQTWKARDDEEMVSESTTTPGIGTEFQRNGP